MRARAGYAQLKKNAFDVIFNLFHSDFFLCISLAIVGTIGAVGAVGPIDAVGVVVIVELNTHTRYFPIRNSFLLDACVVCGIFHLRHRLLTRRGQS